MSEPVAAAGTGKAVVRFVVRLAQLMRTAPLYDEGHAALDFTLRAVSTVADEVLATGGAARIHLRGSLILLGEVKLKPPREMEASVSELSDLLADLGAAGLALTGPVDGPGFDRAMRLLLAQDRQAGPGVAAINQLLAEAGVRGLELLSPGGGAVADLDPGPGGGAPAVVALRLYLRGGRAVLRMLDNGPAAVLLAELERVALGLAELVRAHPRLAVALADPRGWMPFEVSHPVHTAILSMAVGARLGLPDAALAELGTCALLAGIGVRALPDDIRARRGRPEQGDAGLWRSVPVESVKLLLALPGLGPVERRRLRIAFEHQRGESGEGPPSAHHWGERHLYSRIIGVVGTYDYLRSGVSQGHPRTESVALHMLTAKAGSLHDPALVGQLEAALKQWEDSDG